MWHERTIPTAPHGGYSEGVGRVSASCKFNLRGFQSCSATSKIIVRIVRNSRRPQNVFLVFSRRSRRVATLFFDLVRHSRRFLRVCSPKTPQNTYGTVQRNPKLLEAFLEYVFLRVWSPKKPQTTYFTVQRNPKPRRPSQSLGR